MKFQIKRVARTRQRPHGLSYSLTLHDASAKRILGFDNAHPVSAPGSRFKRKPESGDHWHRREGDKGRPYEFTDASTLVEDFEREVRQFLADRGIELTIVSAEER